jgi:exopolysaccharide biosynthesis polyprenyl glycosylphosphotransferase
MSVMAGFAVANVVRALAQFLGHGNRSPGFGLYSWASPGALLLYATLLTFAGYSEKLYDAGQATFHERLIVIKAVTMATLLLGAATLLGIDELPLPVLFAAAPLVCGAMMAWRKWAHAGGNQLARRARNILIAGDTAAARQLVDYYGKHPETGCRICGFLEAGPAGSHLLGSMDDLARVARAEFADEIILAMPLHSTVAMRSIREARRNRLDVKIIPDLLGFPADGLETIGDVPLVSLHREALPAFSLLLKRIFDLAGGFALIAAASPLLAAVAICIKIDSRGPVLYRAPRAGRKGRRFLCYKFRTMINDADRRKATLRASNERSGPFFKMVHDPRITRLGRVLRRYSLDELPQLWNVMKGDMSLVGPRPHPLDDVQGYDLDHLRRLDVTPGLTGSWQVTARRDASFQTNLALDVEYIEHWSLWMDLRILCKTFGAVVHGTGT